MYGSLGARYGYNVIYICKGADLGYCRLDVPSVLYTIMDTIQPLARR